MAPDPILAEPGWSQGLNPYSYVNNNPLNAVDPTGMWSVCIRCRSDSAVECWEFVGELQRLKLHA
jgi:hypothetical protein